MTSELFSILKTFAEHPTDFDAQLAQAEAIEVSADEKAQLQAEYLPRMLNDPDPHQRALYGRILGLLDLDNRKGVGLGENGLPEIDWIEIPAGEFAFREDQILQVPTFHMSRYHITYKQFKVFLDAEDGFHDPRWWAGLAEDKDRYKIQNQVPQQGFRFWNHPFDDVCWYDAIAFCRWLSYRQGGIYDIDRVMEWKVRLATEHEWEKAAIGTDGRVFPWGDEYISGYANMDEIDRHNFQEEQAKIQSGKIGQYFYGGPTAVGIFPQGASPYGVMDMIGNVWDIILTDYRYGKNDDLTDYYPRIIKGGAWFVTEIYSKIKRTQMGFVNVRNNGFPRNNDYGFRVCTSAMERSL